jgi:hypothetical protein
MNGSFIDAAKPSSNINPIARRTVRDTGDDRRDYASSIAGTD